MISLVRDSEAISTEVRKVFGDFSNNGFQFPKAIIKHTDAIGGYVETLVLNEMTGKSLLFLYIPPLIHPEGMSIFLQNKSGDTFSIDDFLAHKKIDTRLVGSMNLASYDGALENKLDGVLNASKNIIIQYLDKCLFGDEWQSIPMQWGDLK